MHYELTDEQAQAVASTLTYSRALLANVARSARPAEKRAWAAERVRIIDEVLAILPKLTEVAR